MEISWFSDFKALLYPSKWPKMAKNDQKLQKWRKWSKVKFSDLQHQNLIAIWRYHGSQASKLCQYSSKWPKWPKMAKNGHFLADFQKIFYIFKKRMVSEFRRYKKDFCSSKNGRVIKKISNGETLPGQTVYFRMSQIFSDSFDFSAQLF